MRVVMKRAEGLIHPRLHAAPPALERLAVRLQAEGMPLFPAGSVLATSPGTDDVFPLHAVRPFVVSPCLEPTSLMVKLATVFAPACVRTVAVERALISDCFVHLSQQPFRRLEGSRRLGPSRPTHHSRPANCNRQHKHEDLICFIHVTRPSSSAARSASSSRILERESVAGKEKPRRPRRALRSEFRDGSVSDKRTWLDLQGDGR